MVENLFNYVINTAADGLASWEAGASADAVITMFEPWI